MGKLKSNQKGFGTIEAVLVLVIVVAIAGVGYYVYHANKNASNTLNQASQVSSSSNPTYAKKPVKSVSTTTAAQAGTQAKSIQTALEAYYTVNKNYPGDLTPAPLVGLNGATSVTTATFTAPSGTKFVYKAAPSGCSTASKTCKSYSLEALDTNTGKVISVLNSKY